MVTDADVTIEKLVATISVPLLLILSELKRGVVKHPHYHLTSPKGRRTCQVFLDEDARTAKVVTNDSALVDELIISLEELFSISEVSCPPKGNSSFTISFTR